MEKLEEFFSSCYEDSIHRASFWMPNTDGDGTVALHLQQISKARMSFAIQSLGVLGNPQSFQKKPKNIFLRVKLTLELDELI